MKMISLIALFILMSAFCECKMKFLRIVKKNIKKIEDFLWAMNKMFFDWFLRGILFSLWEEMDKLLYNITSYNLY